MTKKELCKGFLLCFGAVREQSETMAHVYIP